jgi:hypothetical protein
MTLPPECVPQAKELPAVTVSKVSVEAGGVDWFQLLAPQQASAPRVSIAQLNASPRASHTKTPLGGAD